MDEERPPLSRGETDVLKALWEIERGSIGEIYASIDSSLEMDYSTAQTYVRRLEAKGYLTAKRVGRNKVYRPAIRKTQVLKEAIDDFVERLFDGEILPMVKHLVDSRRVSVDEIERLMAIVKELPQDEEDASGEDSGGEDSGAEETSSQERGDDHE